ncbi:septum formation initiator family protein [Corynebacterium uterequi]|uniref:Septum formation initiator n=1 Tax=Corynebacterium uterequi TaxID=1072256 RepID=A0A0G3HDI5_9CORY|nr:septum formation initiator family protein [Corynebacterium uterequi]AKK10760.1 septum formation initiator [Corynebacterium uterequi]
MAQRQRSRTRVPVAHRRDSPQLPRLKNLGPRVRKIDARLGLAMGLAALALMAMLVAPVRNYLDGRAEIARLTESIELKQRQKASLQAELERYSDEAYIRQEARRRLGFIEPGEVAFRIVDPRMTPQEQVTTSSTDEAIQPEWYQVLWRSVAEPERPVQ